MKNRAQYLNRSADLNWLFGTHLIHYRYLQKQVNSFIIIGNEDAPELIELYNQKDIILGQLPIAKFENGVLTTYLSF